MAEKPGLGVDASDGPVVDPTANVIALNEAANKRQDDLRELHGRLLEARITHLAEMQRLRADHAKEIRELDTDRLKSIREVDVLAGNTSADRALVAIQTLATVTAGTAETMRATLDQRLGAVTERIGALEKAAYTGAGRSAVSDPALADLAAAIRRLQEGATLGTGRAAGAGQLWALILGGFALIGSLVAIVGFVIRSTSG
jgi:hypothetical protein